MGTAHQSVLHCLLDLHLDLPVLSNSTACNGVELQLDSGSLLRRHSHLHGLLVRVRASAIPWAGERNG